MALLAPEEARHPETDKRGQAWHDPSRSARNAKWTPNDALPIWKKTSVSPVVRLRKTPIAPLRFLCLFFVLACICVLLQNEKTRLNYFPSLALSLSLSLSHY